MNFTNEDIIRHAIDSSEIAKLAKKEKPKKKAKSCRKLHFKITEEDTPIKRAVVECFNRRDDLTYDDLKNYYAGIIADPEEAKHGAYNLIDCLKNRHAMMDKTISIALDFLEMDILFVPRNSDTVIASAKDLVARLKSCPERLPEIIDLLKTEVDESDAEFYIEDENEEKEEYDE